MSVLKQFVGWLFDYRKVKAASANSYLSSLKSLHEIRELNSDSFSSHSLKLLVRGKENLESYEQIFKETRKVMTLPLLKLLGHELARSGWGLNSVLTVWCAAVVGFFGSFRMGEILPFESGNRSDFLLWEDVKFLGKDHILIHVKHPKSRAAQGEFVDLFVVKGHNVCPVKALRILKESLTCWDPKLPVFRFENGVFLTKKKFNGVIQNLLSVHIGSKAGQISCHSFRAAIPSALARFPNIANDWDIKGWARWEGKDYKRYTRLKTEQKKLTFNKAMSIFKIK